MNRFVVVLLAFLLVLSTTPGLASAQSQSNWLSVVSVFDLTGNSLVQPSQPLLAGHAYNVTFDVTIPFDSSSEFSTALNSVLLSHGAQFWYVKTPSYGGYNSSNFNPASHSLTFTQVKGILELSAIFEIPIALTQHVVVSPSVGNVTLHTTLTNFTYLAATVLPKSPVGNLNATVEDQTIQTYLTTYQQKSTLISSGQIDSSYATIVDGILAQAQALYTLGLPDQGTALLNTIVPSSFPAPPSSTMSSALLAGVVVAAIIIVVLIVLMVRGRGRQGFASGVVSEVQKELAVLEVTAAKYDKSLADRLKALRDKLGETD